MRFPSVLLEQSSLNSKTGSRQKTGKTELFTGLRVDEEIERPVDSIPLCYKRTIRLSGNPVSLHNEIAFIERIIDPAHEIRSGYIIGIKHHKGIKIPALFTEQFFDTPAENGTFAGLRPLIALINGDKTI